MTRSELNELFQKYLFRPPTDKEWSIHGFKNYAQFEGEISVCNERNILLKNQNSNVGKIAILLTDMENRSKTGIFPCKAIFNG